MYTLGIGHELKRINFNAEEMTTKQKKKKQANNKILLNSIEFL